MDKGKESVTYVIESLDRVRQNNLSLDVKQVDLCRDILAHYTDRLECRVDTAPEIPSELQVVISALNNVSNDLNLITEVISQDIKELNRSIAE